MELTRGRMEANTLENGKIVKKTDKGLTLMRVEANKLGNIKMVDHTDKGLTQG